MLEVAANIRRQAISTNRGEIAFNKGELNLTFSNISGTLLFNYSNFQVYQLSNHFI